jgi:hypothetical protein
LSLAGAGGRGLCERWLDADGVQPSPGHTDPARASDRAGGASSAVPRMSTGLGGEGDFLVKPEPWRDVLDRLDNARSDQEAQQAAVELIDIVLEGGVAVSANADAVSTSILRGQGLRGSLRVYLLWILFEISRCLGLWASADGQGDTPNIHAGVEREARVAASLAVGYPVYVSLMTDAEPNVRSLASLLIALCAPDPASSARVLAAQDRAESESLAKACTLQALLVALARTPPNERDVELVEHVRGRARSGSTADRGRLRRVIAGNSGASLSQQAHEVLGDVGPLLSDPEGPYWPIELL